MVLLWWETDGSVVGDGRLVWWETDGGVIVVGDGR